jgi:soluble lytic murein transglycosylase-like protein
MARQVLPALLLATALLAAQPAGAEPRPSTFMENVCSLIALHADQNRLPRDFFARLLWKESRFNPNAVSPKGAEGIAQFMPGTAKMRGLEDSFDPRQAIPASAAYLSELEGRFGNLGLAAAAYNSGEARVTRWLRDGGFLPLETENYVLGILGETVDRFAERSYKGTVTPLDAKRPFGSACRNLPISDGVTVAMATTPVLPWGIQVAGNFRREVAIRQWERLRRAHSSVLANYEPVISRVRSPRGRSGIHAVRIGAETRAEADRICERVRSAGGACVVLRNR